MNEELKKFIDNFDLSHPDWSSLPPHFPNCQMTNIDRDHLMKLNSIKTLWEISRPVTDTPGYTPAHGGYRQLESYKSTEIIYDLTVEFTRLFIDKRSRTVDQMVQAARSGKQNIAEGSAASGASPQTEYKLVSVARASLEELLLDYEDFLRQNGLKMWGKDEPAAQAVRKLAYATNRTDKTYKTYMANGETAANALICLIHQANYLLDRQLKTLSVGMARGKDLQKRRIGRLEW